MAKQPRPRPRSIKVLREDLRRSELELSLAESQYTKKLLSEVVESGNRIVSSDEGDGRWDLMSSGANLVDSKDLTSEGTVTDLPAIRKEAYRFWALNDHARGIIRMFEKFVMARGFGVDPEDQRRAYWVDSEDPVGQRRKLKMAPDTDLDATPATLLVWKEFVERDDFVQRAKEIARRCFRDGEVFVRRFRGGGRVALRFVEPDHIQSRAGESKDLTADVVNALTGKTESVKTQIRHGIEVVKDDVETAVAYHATVGDSSTSIPAEDMIHRRCGADLNDLRGRPLLYPVLRRIKQYEQWVESRIVLNKVRTAVALVRKVEGTATQAANLIAGRLPATSSAVGREPQTTSGKREAAFRPGTILTPGPGVSYEFTSANLQAADAAQDGRTMLLAISAGVGLPEMLVTGDWSNANFASTVEARSPAVREWEDWQDFLQPVFMRIWYWVIDEAIAAQVLPKDTKREATIQWPGIIQKNAGQDTERRALLNGSGILSRQTWSAQEELEFNEEQRNIQEDTEASAGGGDDMAGVLAGLATGDGGDSTPVGSGQGRPPKTQAEARARLVLDALGALADLQEATRRAPVEVRPQLEAYVAKARRVLVAVGPRARANGHPSRTETVRG